MTTTLKVGQVEDGYHFVDKCFTTPSLNIALTFGPDPIDARDLISELEEGVEWLQKHIDETKDVYGVEDFVGFLLKITLYPPSGEVHEYRQELKNGVVWVEAYIRALEWLLAKGTCL